MNRIIGHLLAMYGQRLKEIDPTTLGRGQERRPRLREPDRHCGGHVLHPGVQGGQPAVLVAVDAGRPHAHVRREGGAARGHSALQAQRQGPGHGTGRLLSAVMSLTANRQ